MMVQKLESERDGDSDGMLRNEESEGWGQRGMGKVKDGDGGGFGKLGMGKGKDEELENQERRDKEMAR